MESATINKVRSNEILLSLLSIEQQAISKFEIKVISKYKNVVKMI